MSRYVNLIAGVTGSAILVAVPFLLLIFFVVFQVYNKNEKFSFIRSFGVTLEAYRGTSFRGANVTEANFYQALLKNTSFATSCKQSTMLTRAYFKEVRGLEKAEPDEFILANFNLLPLLVGIDGKTSKFINTNLRGINLDGAKLNGYVFKYADLSESSLRSADLQNTNLAETKLIGADLTGAYLTGACIESWNIDKAILNDINCQFCFLREHPDAQGRRERRPHDPDRLYEPGEFEKILSKTNNIVEVLLRHCTTQQEFNSVLQQLMQEHPNLSIQRLEMEHKGNDVLLAIEVPENTDKGQIERSLLQAYDRIKQLEGKVEELHLLRAADAKDIAILALQGQPSTPAQITVSQTQGNHNMTEQDKTSINTGSGSVVNTGTMTTSGSTINLGDISGQVTNTINQLPDTPDSTQPNLKDLLTQLQTALQTDPNLSEDDKAEALSQIQTLAQAGQSPQQPEQKTLAKRALQMLTGIITTATATLTGTTGLLTAWNKLQPLIKGIFGL